MVEQGLELGSGVIQIDDTTTCYIQCMKKRIATQPTSDINYIATNRATTKTQTIGSMQVISGVRGYLAHFFQSGMKNFLLVQNDCADWLIFGSQCFHSISFFVVHGFSFHNNIIVPSQTKLLIKNRTLHSFRFLAAFNINTI